jgi:ABC-type Co2+ transport system permease subunit
MSTSPPPPSLTCEKPQQDAVRKNETARQKRTSAPDATRARTTGVGSASNRMLIAGARSYDRSMSRRDVATLGLLGFFFAVAMSIELYYLVAHDRLVAAAAAHHPLALLLALYAPADRAYLEAPSPLTLALEGINVVVTQPLGGLLAFAIVRRRWWRWPLQLAIGAYVAYSVVLYFTVGALSAFAGMSQRSVGTFAMYFGANLPWLAGAAWMSWEAARALRSAPAFVERDRILAVIEYVGEQPAEVETGRERGDDRERAESLAP